MAHFLRKAAIIGLIAMNSPVHGGKPDEAAPGPAAIAQAVARAVDTAHSDPRLATGGLAAAREAAQILAGLDPALRERVLAGAGALAKAGR